MKHSMIYKSGLFMTVLVLLFCCTHEDGSMWYDMEKKEVQKFFSMEQLRSRSNNLTTAITQVVVNALQRQDNLLKAVRNYKKKHGIPLWEHSVGIVTAEGYQLFVPVYKEESPDEIQTIWFFGVYDKVLYHFTRNRPPQDDIIEEFWRYDYFTIYALGKKTKSGIFFEDKTESRAESVSDCVKAYAGFSFWDYEENKWVDIMVDVSEPCWEWPYNDYIDGDDGTIGGEEDYFDSELPTEDVLEHGSSSGNSSSSSSGSIVAPKAQAIFRNSNMTEDNWKIIERMLDKIVATCMGENLYNGLKKAMNGGTFIIQFKESANGSFGSIGEGVGITLGMQMESNQLFHEMMHAYRSYQETITSYSNSTLNGELEAWYAQYLYTSSLPEYKNSKWERRDNSDKRRKVIKRLNSFIDKKGNLQYKKSSKDLETEILDRVIPAFRKTYTEEKYPYDNTREAIDNFKNIRKLTEGC